MEDKKRLEITSMELHLMAMTFMFCDHLWGTLISGNEWLTCIGRLAFPIFAFMIVEGYFHTHNLKKYVLRLLLFALISEIPYNLMMGSSLIDPFEQNVIWTFLISILLIWLNEKAKATGKMWVIILTVFGTLGLGYVLGAITFIDYNFCGIYMVLVFYFFRGKSVWCKIFQFITLAYINISMLGGCGYEIAVGSYTFFINRQAFALLALIPIWLYRGKQGPHSKLIQYLDYSFYPAHMLVLALIQMYR